MNTSNTSLTPTAPDQRVFTGLSMASLWFSLGVGLLVIQVGAYLVPAMGTQEAFLAILAGSVLGSALLAWTAKLGCDSGLSSAGLMHHVYGPGFARLPVMLNIFQLVGWTTFELVIMRDGTNAILLKALGTSIHPFWSTLLWGAVLVALMTGSMLTLVRKFVSRVGLPLVILSLLWLTWHFVGVLQLQGVDAFLSRSGTGQMGMLSAIDLVIAMPVSWLPLVADYARHAKSSSSTFKGTWIGYAVANAWCYGLGVLVVSVSAPDTDLVSALLIAQGGLLALGLILLDEIDNAYGDVHSSAVSAHSLKPAFSIRTLGMGVAVLCTALAMVLPMHELEPFLLMLSSVFIPLYGVIMGRMGLGQAHQSLNSVNYSAALIWLVGIAIFHAAAQFAPEYGSTLPSLAFTFLLSWLTREKV
jgi:putative hydroxymethylpyrimidine transporter CytX